MQQPQRPNQSCTSRQEQEEGRDVAGRPPGAERSAAAEQPMVGQQEAQQAQQGQAQQQAAIAAVPGPTGELDRHAAVRMVVPILRRAGISGAAFVVSAHSVQRCRQSELT